MATFQRPPTVSDDERAQDIYRDAARIIHARGFDATSMGDIAEAVDLTKGGLYYYIKGKRALLFAIMSFAMDLVEREVVQPTLRLTDPHQRLRSLISGHLRLLIEDPAPMSILVDEEEGLDDEHRKLARARKRKYHALVRETIAEVIADRGDPDDVDVTIATHSLFGMMHWVVRWYRDDGPLDRDQVIDHVTRLALHGIVPRA